MITQAEKKELVDWLNNLEDPELVRIIKSIKESSESPISWNKLPEEVKAGIQRAEEDFKHGRFKSSEEIWKKYEHRL